MAAKKSKDKKKGPRGKKARAKAKLEQVWGEQYNEDERLASKVRIGKSRLNNVDHDGGEGGIINGGDTTKGGKKQMEVIDPLAKKRRGIRPSTFDSFLQRKQKYNHNIDIDKQRRQFYEQQGDDGEESSDDDESSSDDDGMNDGGAGSGGSSFATLLKRISGPSKKHKSSQDRMDVDSDDDDDYSNSSSDDDDSEDDEIEESDAELDQQSDDDVNEEGVSGTVATAEDPYEQHFSRPPLPQLNSLTTSESTSQQQHQKQQQLVVPHTGNNRKVSTSSILKSSSMDVQICGPLLDTFDNIVTSHNNNSITTNTNNSKSTKKKQSSASQASAVAATATKKSWNEFALGPYQHVREVIARNWSTVNKDKSGKKKNNKGDDDKVIFTSLQTVLYPAISRYADVLITSENRQVSISLYLVYFSRMEQYLEVLSTAIELHV